MVVKAKEEPSNNGTVPSSLDIDAQRERILLAGQMGSGKSYALMALCDLIQLHDPEAKIFILDADRGLGKTKKLEWPQVTNIAIHRVARSWEDVEAFIAEVEPIQTARDWVMVDMVGRFWEMAQSLEVSAVHNVSPGQAMLKARKDMVERQKLQAPGTLPQPDWLVIKRFHNDQFVDKLSVEWDAHLVLTTSLNKLDTDRDDPAIVEIFAKYGFKPDGEKYNSHRVDTVIMLNNEGSKRYFSTAKDRGRPMLFNIPYEENLWTAFTDTLKAKGFWFADSLQ